MLCDIICNALSCLLVLASCERGEGEWDSLLRLEIALCCIPFGILRVYVIDVSYANMILLTLMVPGGEAAQCLA
jgi:hypothetical protein